MFRLAMRHCSKRYCINKGQQVFILANNRKVPDTPWHVWAVLISSDFTRGEMPKRDETGRYTEYNNSKWRRELRKKKKRKDWELAQQQKDREGAIQAKGKERRQEGADHQWQRWREKQYEDLWSAQYLEAF